MITEHFTLYSDLHTEFWDGYDVLDPGTGDLLILAGDIGMVYTLNTFEGTPYENFLRKCSEGYNKVFYTLGNHEFYGGDFATTVDKLREYTSKYNNITVLDNNSEYYNGVHYVGGTMWANFNNMDNRVMRDCGYYMNDYHQITNKNTPLTPNDTLIEHKHTIEWFERCLNSLNGPVVMITHHAPSVESLDSHYVGSDVSGAYFTDMTKFINNHPNITHWVHGHIHSNNNYYIGECNVLSNPFGYHSDALNKHFIPSVV